MPDVMPPAIELRVAKRNADSEVTARAVNHALAANPLIGVRRGEIVKAMAVLGRQLVRQPRIVGSHSAQLAKVLRRIVAGTSDLAPAHGDRRFNDAAWTGNAGFRRLLQAYVALGAALDRCVDDADLDKLSRD